MSSRHSLKMQNAPDNFLTIHHVSKHFFQNETKIPVLNDVSLCLKRGEIVCILGKSGCGKTTLLNITCGLEKPSSGTVNVHGTIAYIPQKDLLLPWRTMMENILLPLEIKGS